MHMVNTYYNYNSLYRSVSYILNPMFPMVEANGLLNSLLVAGMSTILKKNVSLFQACVRINIDELF